MMAERWGPPAARDVLSLLAEQQPQALEGIIALAGATWFGPLDDSGAHGGGSQTAAATQLRGQLPGKAMADFACASLRQTCRALRDALPPRPITAADAFVFLTGEYARRMGGEGGAWARRAARMVDGLRARPQMPGAFARRLMKAAVPVTRRFRAPTRLNHLTAAARAAGLARGTLQPEALRACKHPGAGAAGCSWYAVEGWRTVSKRVAIWNVDDMIPFVQLYSAHNSLDVYGEEEDPAMWAAVEMAKCIADAEFNRPKWCRFTDPLPHYEADRLMRPTGPARVRSARGKLEAKGARRVGRLLPRDEDEVDGDGGAVGDAV